LEKIMSDLTDKTLEWAEFILDKYKNNDSLTQIFIKGPFAGMSQREVVGLAKRFIESDEKYPVNP